MGKLCVLFPGVGYTNLKPLLYYSGKIAIQEGYELLQIEYSNLPSKIFGDEEKMKEAFSIALSQAESQLSQVKWEDYEDVIFVGKSIGTVIAAAVTASNNTSINNSFQNSLRILDEKGVKVRYIYHTPLEYTFSYAKSHSGIAFFGDADPWSEIGNIRNEAERLGIPLHIYEGGNHSLETGDVRRDISILADVMDKVYDFITEETK